MTKENLYVDIHVLQTVPSSNINRDDSGAPKTALYGGVMRARVSSQSWKRAIRKAFCAESNGKEWLNSFRTKKFPMLLAEKVQEKMPGVGEKEALEKSLELLKAAGIKVSKDKNTGEQLTGALVFVSVGQLEKLADYIINHPVLHDEDKKAIKNGFNAASSLDLALFGRMVADDPELNVDAAAQVAHAISTHEVIPEFDYFTGLDDVRADDTAGAAMLGTMEYNSSTLYRYANVNMYELVHNLGKELADKGLELFIKDFIMSMPTGKQNSYANKTVPQYVLVTLRKDTPVNLVSAFEEPVESRNGYVMPSIKKLEKEFESTCQWVEKPLLTVVLTGKETTLEAKATNLQVLLDKVTDGMKRVMADGCIDN